MILENTDAYCLDYNAPAYSDNQKIAVSEAVFEVACHRCGYRNKWDALSGKAGGDKWPPKLRAAWEKHMDTCAVATGRARTGKKRWSVAYAYPTSTNAEDLGCGDTGCYYIAEEIMREDWCWSAPYIYPLMDEGFAQKDDPDLLALLDELREDI